MSLNQRNLLAFCCIVFLLGGCKKAEMPATRSSSTASTAEPASAASVKTARATVVKSSYGVLPDGTAIDLYTMTNASGMQVKAISFGGVVTSIKVPDRKGELADVVLGYDSLDEYVKNPPHFGALIGRYGNRIGKAQFTLNGKTYPLIANNNGNTLHGGPNGFDKKVWQAESFDNANGVGIVLTRASPDGEEGFPGNLSVRVTYTLTNANELSLEYFATTDKPTVVNLTHHDYFNLAGEGSGDVLSHRLQIKASRFTPVNATMVPTGHISDVSGTPLDFKDFVPIGRHINSGDPLITGASGYDHNFVLDHPEGELSFAARVEEPNSGRAMEVRTTEPGMQFYTANHLDGSKGKGGHAYAPRTAFCLETQHFPDSPNQPEFPSTTLLPGQEYRSHTVYTFSAR
jgi:aldose 1-epimerase